MTDIPRLSIIIPTLDEAATIEELLTRLTPWEADGVEVVVVDGGSLDDTVARARPLASTVIVRAPGRARQMNAGAGEARGHHLLFLHADTRLPPRADLSVETALSGQCVWGRFDVRLEGRHPLLPVIAGAMNLRSRLTDIATGDQGLFMTREAFVAAGGFPDQPLMEDIEMSRRLKRQSPPTCLTEKVTSSGRRWDQQGAWTTIRLMWRLRWCYWRGAAADDLARAYHHVR
ncbi:MULTISPECIES: TIGR04283 family arsenosugar biosynthesis glycosyltransferase [unclassified Halomonas]|uniref:TIGR04283 family arsenosugar biosynthesis glycosyltransferase n=1 Tax=unclassified Halomonas TaxID=2609666 RepID=UPI0024693CE6|nr:MULTISPECIES: TIGR04283 family arsenosugar biosynthesis glycosyltransferase [unclassified Halomonas]